ncbi:MAG: hypothetical protein VB049_12240 [Candidatus Pelethousia sp.]|nr:hypothetical protein [Candidatus Pelethousia sp.]
MRKCALLRLAVCCILLCLLPSFAYAGQYGAPVGTPEVPPEIQDTFDAALLLERSTKAVLYQKDTERVFSPTGSAVNLMTAYILRQEADFEQEIPVIDAVESLSSGARKVGLKPGQRWLIKDLVATLLLYGAQDAALVLCDHVCGTEEAFVARMNEYAQSLGMENTVYKNCLGAYAQEQVSTVSDLMLLCEAVLRDDILRGMLGKSTYDAINGKTIENRMEIMQDGQESFDARIRGIGEGATEEAGANILLYAVDGDQAWLFVGYRKDDDQRASEKHAITLLNYGSQAYHTLDITPLVENMLQRLKITTEDGGSVSLAGGAAGYKISAEASLAREIGSDTGVFSLGELPRLETAPEKGAAIGTVWLQWAEQNVLEIPLLAGVVTPPSGTGAQPQDKREENNLEIPVYTVEDWPGADREQRFTTLYGSWIIIGAATLLAAIILLWAHRLRPGKR